MANVVERLEEIIDQEKKVKHSKLSGAHCSLLHPDLPAPRLRHVLTALEQNAWTVCRLWALVYTLHTLWVMLCTL